MPRRKRRRPRRRLDKDIIRGLVLIGVAAGLSIAAAGVSVALAVTLKDKSTVSETKSVTTEITATSDNKELEETLEIAEASVISEDIPETTSAPAEETALYSWSESEAYLLAKIAMAEAEGEDTYGKALVVLVVLNRVQSDSFADTVEGVIYEDSQFTAVANGRYDSVEPNDDCYAALALVQETETDFSEGALFFESSASGSTWHSRNLEFLFQYGNHKFYK